MSYAPHHLFLAFLLPLLAGPSDCIIRGNISAPDQWPSIASLHTFTYKKLVPTAHFRKSCPEINVVFDYKKLYWRDYYASRCAGVVWDTRTILTAGHCTQGLKPAELEVNIGEHDQANLGKLFEVKKIVIHKDYNTPDENDNDFALLRLASPINAQYRGRAFQASKQYVPWSLVKHTGCVVLGWGRTENGYYSRYLREAVINLEPQSNGWGTIFTANSSSTSGICGGDSGGPVFCPLLNDSQSYSLVGISSSRADEHCRKGANRGQDGFTFVEHYLEWIEKTIQHIEFEEYLEEIEGFWGEVEDEEYLVE